MEYIFVYSFRPNHGDITRDFGRHVCEIEPGVDIWDTILKVEDYLRYSLDWWCDAKVINVIPNIIPVQMAEIYYEKAIQALAANPIPVDLLKKKKPNLD